MRGGGGGGGGGGVSVTLYDSSPIARDPGMVMVRVWWWWVARVGLYLGVVVVRVRLVELATVICHEENAE